MVVVAAVTFFPISLPLLLSLSVLFVALFGASVAVETAQSIFDVGTMLDTVLLSPSSPVV